MTITEAYSMTAREFVRQLAQQMVVITAMENWTPAEKAQQIRALHESAWETWIRHGIATAEHLLRENQNSRLDFSPELKNGIARPAEPSVGQTVERKTA